MNVVWLLRMKQAQRCRDELRTQGLKGSHGGSRRRALEEQEWNLQGTESMKRRAGKDIALSRSSRKAELMCTTAPSNANN